MSIASQFVALMYGLREGTHAIDVKKDIDIISSDNIALKTDIYTPKSSGPHPTLLMRTPYGRLGFGMVAEIYAERGYRTLLQACRGTDGSGGEFDPLVNERTDGLATLEWIKSQDWFDGRLGITGPSYLGYATWAISDELPEGAAICAKVTTSDFESVVFPGGAFHLQLWLSWLQTIYGLENELFGMTLRIMSGDVERRTRSVGLTLPLIEADVAAVGEVVPFWRQWFGEAVNNGAFWDARRHTQRLNENTPPNSFVSGWYDIMVDQQIADYRRLVELGHTPHLTIGRWFHTDNELQGECMRQTLSWMDKHLCDDQSSIRYMPVRIYVGGTNRWHEMAQYPPATIPQKLFLQAQASLGSQSPLSSAPDRYVYDPNDPTPNKGGAIFAFAGAGARDNSSLEARDDVLVFSGPALKENTTIIGNVTAKIFVRSSLRYTDFFMRLCDVDTHGVSTNICDGILRLTPGSTELDANGVHQITIRLHATAHTWLKGHCFRLQISSGAHPRYARNLGTDEPVGTATTILVADQEVFHDPEHPSAITLPVATEL